MPSSGLVNGVVRSVSVGMVDAGGRRVNVGSKREGVLGGHWSRVREDSGAERESGSPADDDPVGLQRAGYSFPEADEVDV